MGKAELIEGKNAVRCEVCGELVCQRLAKTHKARHEEAKQQNTEAKSQICQNEGKLTANLPNQETKPEQNQQNQSKICKEISLKAESDRLKEKIEPKPEAKTAYKCGSCGASMRERAKFCPSCGVEFE